MARSKHFKGEAKGMSGYRSVINSIPDWQSKTDAEIVAEAIAKTIPYADPEWWSSWGVAACIGAEKVKPLLARLRTTDFDWVADAITGNKAPFGDANVNAMMLASGDPDLIKLAQATRYNKSLCDQFGVAEDEQAIIDTARLMRVEIEREAGKAESRARYNANMTAWDIWPGPPAERPQL